MTVDDRGGPGQGVEDRLARLLRTLAATHDAIAELAGGEVDAVVDPVSGRPWLLREAQAAVVAGAADRARDAAFRAAVIDAIPANVAVLDHQGTVVAVNEDWRRFGRSNGADDPDGRRRQLGGGRRFGSEDTIDGVDRSIICDGAQPATGTSPTLGGRDQVSPHHPVRPGRGRTGARSAAGVLFGQ